MKTFLKNTLLLTLFVSVLALSTGCEAKTTQEMSSDVNSAVSQIGDTVSSEWDDLKSDVQHPNESDNSEYYESNHSNP